jgi:hypothetical protein
MALRSPLLIEDSHQIGAFDSGVPALDDWVKRRARANQASGAAATSPSLVVAAAKKLVAEKRDEERLLRFGPHRGTRDRADSVLKKRNNLAPIWLPQV